MLSYKTNDGRRAAESVLFKIYFPFQNLFASRTQGDCAVIRVFNSVELGCSW